MAKRDIITKQFSNYGRLSMSSVQHFVDSGKPSGTFLLSLQAIMEEYAKNKDERIKELEEVLNTTLFDSDCVNNVTNLSVFNRQVIENCLKK